MRRGLLCLLGLLVVPSLGHGYQTNSSGGQILRWADASLPLAWYMNMNGYTGISAADAESAFTHGMAQWSAPACTKFRAVYKGTSTRGNTSDKTNVLLFGPLSAGSSTTAITYTRWGSRSKRYTDADIVFRTTKPWSISPSSGQLDLRGTATHEIGHLLGLAHSSVRDATMYAKTSSGPSPRRFLDQDDIRGVCFLYPASGTPTPECSKDSDCASSQVCQDQKCISKTEGRGALCGQSAGGASCNQGLLCVNKSGQPAYCVEYCQSGGCPNGGKCLKTTSGSQFCACDGDGDCKSGQVCKNRNCFSTTNTPCKANADCLAPLQCLEGTCQSPPAGCQSDSDCPDGKICDVGKCMDAPLRGFGESCQSAADCTSKLCEAIGAGSQRFCTKACKAGGSDCPAGYTCKAHPQGQELCHVDPGASGCSTDADCPRGQKCQQKQCVAAPEPGTPEPPASEPSSSDATDRRPDAPRPEPAGEGSKPPTPERDVAEAKPPHTGCGCQETGGRAFGLLALLLLLALTTPASKKPSSL